MIAKSTGARCTSLSVINSVMAAIIGSSSFGVLGLSVVCGASVFAEKVFVVHFAGQRCSLRRDANRVASHACHGFEDYGIAGGIGGGGSTTEGGVSCHQRGWGMVLAGAVK